MLTTKVTWHGTFVLLAGPEPTFMIFGKASLGNISQWHPVVAIPHVRGWGNGLAKGDGARGKISTAVVERRRRSGYRRVCGHAGSYSSDSCRYDSPYRVERQQRVLSSWQLYPLKRYPSFHRDHQAAAIRHTRRVLWKLSPPNFTADRVNPLEPLACD